MRSACARAWRRAELPLCARWPRHRRHATRVSPPPATGCDLSSRGARAGARAGLRGWGGYWGSGGGGVCRLGGDVDFSGMCGGDAAAGGGGLGGGLMRAQSQDSSGALDDGGSGSGPGSLGASLIPWN